MKTILLITALIFSAITGLGQVPPTPTIVVCEVNFQSNGTIFAHLVWLDESNTETAFHVERAEVRGNKPLEWISPWGYFIADLPIMWDGTIDPKKIYRYRVRALNDYGFSEWSNEVLFVGPHRK